MPTNMVRTLGSFGSVANILYNEVNLSAPQMITMDLANFSGGGQSVVVMPGSVICRMPNGLGRVMPASKATVATPTTARVITVNNITVYKVGDLLVKGPGGEAVGTIQSIDPVTNTITLVANTTTAIAIGDSVIGSGAATLGQFLGITVSECNITDHTTDLACFNSANVFAARMPYWDTTLQNRFPMITLVDPSV